MIPIEQLRELQARFEPLRILKQKHHKKLEKLRRSFIEHFPHAQIQDLSLGQFVQGKGEKSSFCYWVEIKTSDLGHIQGSPSPKFGIYYSKKKGAFLFTKKYKNEEDARSRILQEIDGLLAAAANRNIDAIRKAEISPMFKGKILSLYYPEQFINIFSERHVDHFLNQLRISQPGGNLDLISKKELLTEIKNADEVMVDWTNFEFSDFLYWAWHPPARDAKVPEALKDYIVDFPDPKDTAPEFIELQISETVESLKASLAGRGKLDFAQKNRRNKLVGDQGENIVFFAEKQSLERGGRTDLASKVRAICKEDDSAGYDILSFEPGGKEKQIEVKATTRKIPKANENFGFYISANEYEHAKKLSNFYLYIVFEVKTKKPKIWRIQNPAVLEPKQLHLKPSSYYATLTIA